MTSSTRVSLLKEESFFAVLNENGDSKPRGRVLTDFIDAIDEDGTRILNASSIDRTILWGERSLEETSFIQSNWNESKERETNHFPMAGSASSTTAHPSYI
jgi:hypothetical protein